MVLFFHIGMRLSVLVFIVGVALIFGGVNALGVAMKTKDKPTPITAAELSRSGPPKDNAYVHVTEYGINSEFIKMTKDKAAANDWSGVWLQIMPLSGGRAVEGGKPIILKDENLKSQADILNFMKYSAFDAIVTNGTGSLTDLPSTPEGMHFPYVTEKDDWILEMKARPDFFYGAGMTFLGVLMCVGGVLPAYLQGRRARAAKAASSGTTSRKL